MTNLGKPAMRNREKWVEGSAPFPEKQNKS